MQINEVRNEEQVFNYNTSTQIQQEGMIIDQLAEHFSGRELPTLNESSDHIDKYIETYLASAEVDTSLEMLDTSLIAEHLEDNFDRIFEEEMSLSPASLVESKKVTIDQETQTDLESEGEDSKDSGNVENSKDETDDDLQVVAVMSPMKSGK